MTGTISQTEWNKKEDGILNIKFYANNSVGLIGSAEIMVAKHVSGGGSPGVPGYNLITLFGVAIVTTLLIVKKKLKKGSKPFLLFYSFLTLSFYYKRFGNSTTTLITYFI